MKEGEKDMQGENKADSSSVEPQSDMLVIMVNSSKEQKDTSTENLVQGNSNNVSRLNQKVRLHLICQLKILMLVLIPSQFGKCCQWCY